MNRSPAPTSALSAFFRDLPENLQTPAAIALLGSVGAHALFFATLPAFTSAEDNPEEVLRKVDLVQLSPQEQGKLPATGDPSLTLPPVTQIPDTQIQLPPGLNSVPSPIPTSPALSNPSLFYPLPGTTQTPGSSAPAPVFDYSKFWREFPRPRLSPAPTPSPSASPEPRRSDEPSPTEGLQASNPNLQATTPPPPGGSAPTESSTPTPTPSPTPTPTPSPPQLTPQQRLALIQQTTFNPAGTESDPRWASLLKEDNPNDPRTQQTRPVRIWGNWFSKLDQGALERGEIKQIDHPNAEEKEAAKLEPGQALTIPVTEFPNGIQNFQQKRIIVIAQTKPNGELIKEPEFLVKPGYGFLDQQALNYVKEQLKKPEVVEKMNRVTKDSPQTKVLLHRFEFQFKPPDSQKVT
jgi:hypothetical protein